MTNLKWLDFLKQFDCTTTESTTDLPRVEKTVKLSMMIIPHSELAYHSL